MGNAQKLLIGTALGLSAASAPAQVLQPPDSIPSSAKAEAILGGESRLAAMLAQQGAARAVLLRPASYGLPRVAARGTPFRRVPSVASNERPNVFGTVALKVRETSLDGRWRRVERARVGGKAAGYATSLRRIDEQSRIEAINRYVNRRVKFSDDSREYRRADLWATANETLARGRGDCEDYAIAKLQMLRKAGVPDANLYLVILKDLVRRSDHAVAVVRSGGQMLVLDNGTDDVLESEAIYDYRPVLTFAANGTWTHGYKVAQAPVEVAQAAIAGSVPVPADSGLDQRSRSASLLALNTGFSR